MNTPATEAPTSAFLFFCGLNEDSGPRLTIGLCPSHAEFFGRHVVPMLRKAGLRTYRFPVGGVFAGIGEQAREDRPCKWCLEDTEAAPA